MLRVDECGSDKQVDEFRHDNRDLGDGEPPGLLFERYREFSALATRLEADEKGLGMEMHSQEFEALWERRSQLARELVDTPAPAIADVVFKMTIVSSLVAKGEVRLGLTKQCGGVRAGARGRDRRRTMLHGAGACAMVHSNLPETRSGRAEDFEFSETWWDEVCEGVHAAACHQARTPVGLRAKG